MVSGAEQQNASPAARVAAAVFAAILLAHPFAANSQSGTQRNSAGEEVPGVSAQEGGPTAGLGRSAAEVQAAASGRDIPPASDDEEYEPLPGTVLAALVLLFFGMAGAGLALTFRAWRDDKRRRKGRRRRRARSRPDGAQAPPSEKSTQS
jgi:hypothetical protein